VNTVTKEQLAELANGVFTGADADDIPEKLWLDEYVAGDQLYLRGTFTRSASVTALALLVALARTVDQTYGTDLVVVLYVDDLEWEELEERNRRLNLVL
jgi:hypothetical protein